MIVRPSRYDLQRAGEVALRDLHVADFLVGHREIAPPAGVAGVGLRQAVAIARLSL